MKLDNYTTLYYWCSLSPHLVCENLMQENHFYFIYCLRISAEVNYIKTKSLDASHK